MFSPLIVFVCVTMAEVVKGIAGAVGLNGDGLNVCIVRTQWNTAIIDALTAGASNELTRLGARTTIIEVRVVG